jgi:CubicO group peptidase (beta-lactamase class C family)
MKRIAPAALVLLLALASATPTHAQHAPPLVHGLPTAAPAEVGMSADALARITPAIQAYVDSARFGGVLVAVARQGRVAYFQAVGFADIERGVPLTDDAVFRIYSMTKPVTAAAVMKLVDQGRLSLEDPVARYLPAFERLTLYQGGGADAPVLGPVTRTMTVQDLLAHTSGMAYGLGSSSVDTLVQRFDMFRGERTARGLADTLATIPFLFEPGTRWGYGPGLEVAVAVVEAVAGESFEAFAEREILNPLRMHSTAWRLTPALRERLATPYRPVAGALQPMGTEDLLGGGMFEPESRFICGGCGLLSTAGDYLRFAQMLLNGGELDGVRVLSGESVRRMTTNVLPPSIPGIANWMGPGYAQGLGLGVQVGPLTDAHPTPPGTFSWAGAANTWFWVDPENELILMAWTQYFPSMHQFASRLKPLVYDAVVVKQGREAH